MNGKPQEKLRVVEKEKAAKVNRQINKKFQKRDEWSFVPAFYLDFIKLTGKILFIPVILIMAVMEGVRAGFIAGAQKALSMYR